MAAEAQSILNELAALNVRIRAERDRLLWHAPASVMTDALKAQLKAYKTDLLALLKNSAADSYDNNNNQAVLGDCLDVLKTKPENSVDLILTDPPYGIEFMGKNWDKALPSIDIWKECLRVLKPGAFAFIMSSPRQDVLGRMISNLEEAGFITGFTSLYWTYAVGFSSASNISKTVDKKLGYERNIIARNPNSRENCDKSNTIYESGTVGKTAHITRPASSAANQLDGSYAGFQPSPAVEVIIVAMKPLDEKTYVGQALKNGKGVTRLDDCRIPYPDGKVWSAEGGVQWSPEKRWNSMDKRHGSEKGRVPANLLVSDDVLNDGKKRRAIDSYSQFFSLDAWWEERVSKLPEHIRRNLPYLIVPKASPREKNTGLNGFQDKTVNDGRKKDIDNPFQRGKTLRKNTHPTVKPVKLFSYLITMGSRKGDVVLDPFAGSMTTAIAAILLQRGYIMIEKEKEYFDIGTARIRHSQEQHSSHLMELIKTRQGPGQ
jgi:DNA modification methylase